MILKDYTAPYVILNADNFFRVINCVKVSKDNLSVLQWQENECYQKFNCIIIFS